jgi:3'-phosphoadenosine 5'-phosphosulfate (PAPS) 3'-phosphatase
MLEDVTQEAVQAALKVIDDATCGTSNKSSGSCGDQLAYKLHELILDALRQHYKQRGGIIQ